MTTALLPEDDKCLAGRPEGQPRHLACMINDLIEPRRADTVDIANNIFLVADFAVCADVNMAQQRSKQTG